MNADNDAFDAFDDGIDAEVLLLSVDPVEPRAETRRALLQCIAGPWYWPFVRRVAALCEVSTEVARGLLSGIDDAARWMLGPAAGVQAFHIDAGAGLDDAIVGFIRLAPGAVFPEHTHVGGEDVLVLQGGFIVNGAEVKAGCEAPMAAGTQHEVRAGAEGCLYLGIVRGGMDFGAGPVGPEDPRL